MYAKFKCSTGLDTPEGSPSCRGRWAWVPRRPLELCRRELRLLVGPPKLNRSKDRGATKHDPPVLQVRELGKGLTSLSCKTPMLRKRQWRKLTLLGETGFQSHQNATTAEESPYYLYPVRSWPRSSSSKRPTQWTNNWEESRQGFGKERDVQTRSPPCVTS